MDGVQLNLNGLTFDDVLLRPQKGVLFSRKDADISAPAFGLDIPIFSAPMPSVSSVELLSNIAKLGGGGVINRMGKDAADIIHDFYKVDFFQFNLFAALGLESDISLFHQANLRKFVLDVAHAHTNKVSEHVARLKARYDDIYLIVGNVATAEGAQDLIDAGADALKVGIGPGSVCTTRQVTGFGVPQLEAIEQCSLLGVPTIADGGIRNSGDIVKALAAGADAVMIGSLFAHSIEAQNDGTHYGCASNRINDHHAPEGIEKELTGDPEPLEAIVKRLTWGIKSGLSYGGATNIKELQENAEWIRISEAGRVESKLA